VEKKMDETPKYEFYSYSRQRDRLHLLFYVYYFVGLGAFKSVKRINAAPRNIPRALSPARSRMNTRAFPPRRRRRFPTHPPSPPRATRESSSFAYYHTGDRKNANDPKPRVEASICVLRYVLSV
jgi:hypothetical protein